MLIVRRLPYSTKIKRAHHNIISCCRGQPRFSLPWIYRAMSVRSTKMVYLNLCQLKELHLRRLSHVKKKIARKPYPRAQTIVPENKKSVCKESLENEVEKSWIMGTAQSTYCIKYGGVGNYHKNIRGNHQFIYHAISSTDVGTVSPNNTLLVEVGPCNTTKVLQTETKTRKM